MHRDVFISPLVAVALCFSWCLPCAATDVSGVISSNTSWPTNGSPYVVTDDLLVADGVQLTIEPGVKVQIGAGFRITVQGALAAIGTATDMITFTRRPADSYGGSIYVQGQSLTNLSASASFNQCVFYDLTGAPILAATYAVVTVRRCEFFDCPTVIFRPVDSRASFAQSAIHDTHEAINYIRCAGDISSNHISRLFGAWDAVDLDAYWVGPGSTSMVVRANHIWDCNDDAIDINFCPALVEYNLISNITDKGISLGLGGNEPDVLEPGATAVIRNNIILGCDIGMAPKDGSTPMIANNTIVGCNFGIDSYEKTAGADGGGGSASNSIIWGCGVGIALDAKSTLDVGYSCVQGATVWPGPGNTNLDPQFADPLLADYHLLPGSPCINSGFNMPWMSGAHDFDDAARISDGIVDMGAYEDAAGSLSCNFISTPLDGQMPLAVDFTSYVSGTNLTQLYFVWDVDGNGSRDYEGLGLDAIHHVYTNFGRQTVSLAVSNSLGAVAAVSKPDYITVSSSGAFYVATSGAHVYPYDNWSKAATNIESVTDLAFGEVLVLVSNGTYYPAHPIVLTESITLRSTGGPHLTVIDGSATNRCLYLGHPTATVEGFTLRNGTADFGAGVYLNNGGVMRDCIITNNVAADSGGGVYFNRGGSVQHCLVTGNQAGNDGGGIFHNAGGEILNCLVTRNLALDSGGGSYCSLAGGSIRSSTYSANTCLDSGGGIRCSSGGAIRNTIAYFNNAPNGPNRALAGSGYSFAYTCTTPLVTGTGNTTADPRFINRATDDYRISADSPCADTGGNEAWMSGAKDFDGKDRIVASIVDIGAYESRDLRCRFSGAPRRGLAPLPTVFTASANGTDLAGLYYTWDFDGDGTNDLEGADLATVTNTYVEFGRFSVGLTISNAMGDVAGATEVDYITILTETVLVSRAGAHIFPYAYWSTAATNLQAAVDAAVPGTFVLVAADDYQLPGPVTVSKPLTVLSVAGASSTILHAAPGQRVLYLADSGARADGFTLIGGAATRGGGIYLDGGGHLLNSVVAGNTATERGGGVYCAGGGTLLNCRISGNASSSLAGGIYCEDGGLIQTCVVSNNTSLSSGGGVYLTTAASLLDSTVVANRCDGPSSSADDGGGVFMEGGGLARNCLVTFNHAGDDGGGLQGNYGGLIQNCTVISNTAVDKGGGIFLWPGGEAENCLVRGNTANYGGGASCRDGGIFRHCTIAGNRAAGSSGTGGGIYANTGGSILNSIVYYNTGVNGDNFAVTASGHSIEHTCITPPETGTGNIAVPPQFADPAVWDYSLQPQSPCIDAGAGLPLVDTDIVGTPRPLDGDTNGVALPDMGAYEYLNSAADSDGDGMSDGSELIAGTGPTDPQDHFRIEGAAALSGVQTLTLWWNGVALRLYTLQSRTNLLSGTWTDMPDFLDRPGADAVMSYTNTAPQQQGFYKLKVRLAQ